MSDLERDPELDPELGVARPSTTATNAWVELAQRRLPDNVLAAGLFKPNALGRFELASWAGIQQRALLTSSGAYLGERILLAVTPIEVAAFDLRLGRFLGTSVRWGIDDLIVATVPSRSREAEPPPAFLIASRSRAWTRLEIQPINANPVTLHLAELDRRRRRAHGGA